MTHFAHNKKYCKLEINYFFTFNIFLFRHTLRLLSIAIQYYWREPDICEWISLVRCVLKAMEIMTNAVQLEKKALKLVNDKMRSNSRSFVSFSRINSLAAFLNHTAVEISSFISNKFFYNCVYKHTRRARQHVVFIDGDVKVGNAIQLLLNTQSDRTRCRNSQCTCCAFFIHFAPQNNFTSSLRVEPHVKVPWSASFLMSSTAMKWDGDHCFIGEKVKGHSEDSTRAFRRSNQSRPLRNCYVIVCLDTQRFPSCCFGEIFLFVSLSHRLS
jgi:hypothetical protein